mmetsp:Transcript_61472/g.150445  ORF Transcript_61472/g.150445 Transcript_61472/m.150445 type:complete len:320 (+) Transcript_61472:272-1231(+)|eukprot:CAMPEP_0113486136 /NCGR_PEP_ID=MMETSP0014_2-20120614/24841_1 /TAXON_ID=2857 /ORGANISM="Nitzschia sp." /LENGTH=319 /DNA_ID=CAMNT_0000379799 /DNA_START=136 /DNA_END=1095 /DNA_ORIENTATION=+ /assembly_acc=CAM_ASM_000159
MSKRPGEEETADPNKKVKTDEGAEGAPPAVDAAAVDSATMYEDDCGPDVSAPYTDGALAEWNAMFFKLMAFRANNGHVNVKSSDDANKDLYKWVSQLRKDYKQRERSPESCTLSREQIQVLQSIYFAFTTRGEEHWQKSFAKLKQFRDAHGHVMVPRQCEYPGLGDWVTSQRQQYQDYVLGKPTPLSRQRKEMLDSLGFAWRVRNRPEWTSKYAELVAYKEQHGDTKVPQHFPENKALGKWVAKQREQYKLKQKGKHSFLTADREEKLNTIGFVWSVRGETGIEGMEPAPPAPPAEVKPPPVVAPEVPMKEEAINAADV